MKRFRLIAIFVLTATIIISAHEGKEHKKTISEAMPDTIIVVGKDTFAINGKAVNKSVLKQEPVVEKEPEFVLKPGEQIFAHLHNKMVHFPIVLTLVAFLFSLLNIKRRDYDLVIKILLGLSFVAAIGAFFTGNIQLAPFIGDPKEWLANRHRLTGIISSILVLLWGASLFIERIKKYSWVIGLIVVAAILITGFLGGVLAH